MSEQERQPEETSSAGVGDSAAMDEILAPAEEPAAEAFADQEFDDGDGYADAGDQDLEARAMAAAERALAAGQEALQAAQAAGAALAPRSPVREWTLRGLLAFNLLLMAGVLLLPEPAPQPEVPAPVTGGHSAPGPAQRQEPSEPPAPAPIPETDDRYTAALLRAANGDLTGAVEELERFLAAEPHMPAAMKRNVLSSLAHYSFRLGHEQRAREFERQAEALTQSHFLPEDLVKMARQAEAEGDGQRMRRLYARFLLQQKQIPPSMHRFLAEAYLKLGDSYRIEAERGERQAEREAAVELRPVAEDKAEGKGGGHK